MTGTLRLLRSQWGMILFLYVATVRRGLILDLPTASTTEPLVVCCHVLGQLERQFRFAQWTFRERLEKVKKVHTASCFGR